MSGRTWSLNTREKCGIGRCTAPYDICAACRCQLYFGRARNQRRTRGSRKATKPGHLKRAELFLAKGFVLAPYHHFCTHCNDIDIYELQFHKRNWVFQTVQLPEYINNAVQQNRKHWEREREHAKRQSERQRRDPDNVPISIDTLNDKQIKYLSGLTLTNLYDIVTHVNAKKVTRSFKVDDLFIACTVWKHNLPYRCAAILFGYGGHQGVKKVIDRVIPDLTRYWVPDHVGYGYWKDRDISNHQPIFVRRLHPDDNVVGIIDATYLYSQKSQRNYQYQKVSSFVIEICESNNFEKLKKKLLVRRLTRCISTEIYKRSMLHALPMVKCSLSMGHILLMVTMMTI